MRLLFCLIYCGIRCDCFNFNIAIRYFSRNVGLLPIWDQSYLALLSLRHWNQIAFLLMSNVLWVK